MKFCTLNKTICIFFLSTLHLIYIKKEIYLYSKQGWLESLRTTWELWNSSFTLLSNMYRESHLQAYSFQSSRFLLVYFYFRGLASILSHLGKNEMENGIYFHSATYFLEKTVVWILLRVQVRSQIVHLLPFTSGCA